MTGIACSTASSSDHHHYHHQIYQHRQASIPLKFKYSKIVHSIVVVIVTVAFASSKVVGTTAEKPVTIKTSTAWYHHSNSNRNSRIHRIRSMPRLIGRYSASNSKNDKSNNSETSQHGDERSSKDNAKNTKSTWLNIRNLYRDGSYKLKVDEVIYDDVEGESILTDDSLSSSSYLHGFEHTENDDVMINDDNSIELTSLVKSKQTSALSTRGGGIPFNDSTKSGTGLLFELSSSISSYISATKGRSWVVLIFAVVVEIMATTLMKTASDTSSASKMTYSLMLYLFSLLCFAACLKQLDVSVAYAIWSALGTALVSVAGVCMFGEELNATKVISLAFIMVGVAGLNLTDGGH